jgi:hypothetical protein
VGDLQIPQMLSKTCRSYLLPELTETWGKNSSCPQKAVKHHDGRHLRCSNSTSTAVFMSISPAHDAFCSPLHQSLEQTLTLY